MTREELEAEKLRREIEKLERETADDGTTFWDVAPSYGTLITALAALGGIFVTIWKQIKQHEADRRERVDEEFAATLKDLGSKNRAVQAAAGVTLVGFLEPDYERLHDRVFTILLANLKLSNPDVVAKILIQGFEKAVRKKVPAAGAEEEPPSPPDLSRLRAYGIDLSGLDLRGADLGFAELRSADLSGSDLRGVRGWKLWLEKAQLSRAQMDGALLQEARCRGAYFHGTRLVQARLVDADLAEADFRQAQMQGALLRGATLHGANFEQANLADAHFESGKKKPAADLDEASLRSIVKAENWQKAHFDPEVRSRLEELASGTGPDTG
jgi:uncharacterized protein YjbI with pentapeptide repeats